MPLDPQLLEILACPDTHHTPLVYDEPGQTLSCPECGRVYPINDGLPELLLEDPRRDDAIDQEDEAGPASSGGAASQGGAASSGEVLET